jgi:hypothetical protein
LLLKMFQRAAANKERENENKKRKETMEWNRTETLALAGAKCTQCKGIGLRKVERGEVVCNCVLRAAFRSCYTRFRECVNKDVMFSRVSLEHGCSREAGGSWSRKNEEYVADFLTIAKRTLNEEEHRIFRYHFLLGADWRLCTRKLQMEKGLFFHAVYRIQQKLGRVFAELQPYPLFPLSEYFGRSTRSGQSAKVVPIRKDRPSLQESVPLKRSA